MANDVDGNKAAANAIKTNALLILRERYRVSAQVER